MSIISAVLEDCAESLATNVDFHAADYEDKCYCKSNLNLVIRRINESSEGQDREGEATHWGSILLYNDSEMAAGREPGCAFHKWCVSRMASLLRK